MRVYETVLARIEADLASGALTHGDRLPAERALAESLGVSRASVREAIRVLEAMGVVRTAVGSGPDAGAVVIDEAARGIGIAMRLHLAARSMDVSDVVGLRLLLESGAARAAATAVHEGRLQPPLPGAHALLESMDDAGSPADFLELDVAFHLSLVNAAGNVLVESVMSALRGAVQSYVMTGVERIADWPATVGRLRHEHRSILAAVEAGEPEAAERAITDHILRFSAEAGMADRSSSGA